MSTVLGVPPEDSGTAPVGARAAPGPRSIPSSEQARLCPPESRLQQLAGYGLGPSRTPDISTPLGPRIPSVCAPVLAAVPGAGEGAAGEGAAIKARFRDRGKNHLRPQHPPGLGDPHRGWGRRRPWSSPPTHRLPAGGCEMRPEPAA